MASNPSISLSPPQATLSPPPAQGRSRPNSQVISPTQLSTGRLAGNRSPNSMPSSPTSVHSSSSAIFERDIEQPSFASHTIKDPHHISRAMTHELDAAVPSVLSAAISALNVGSEDDVSVIAPAQLNKPRFNPSRSPSPTTRPPLVERQSGPSPPATDTSPALSPHQTGASPTSPLSPVTPPAAVPRPRKSNPQLNTDTNRLSFMSYHDLLASTPVATVPLSSIVSGGGEPGHLPGVIGMHGHRSSGVFDDVSEHQSGGEFDREGLGRGLEERLEGVLREGQARA
ncbi:unnamed protein product [Rhizoctonia solani]|uniref:Uncharacterized protein n=1 Tax=Rhizoctonia solani TaxID=456999 RepID=A0A8H2WX99_9AGAM|nr:unnamed protein product [Rhizoctonia solani]CAE6436616.1 unnamed protein product [Rhizoctonia solani]